MSSACNKYQKEQQATTNDDKTSPAFLSATNSPVWRRRWQLSAVKQLASMTNLTLKEQKEQFVTGLDGTTAAEVLLICSTAATGTWFYLNCVAAYYYRQQQQQQQHATTKTTSTNSNSNNHHRLKILLEVLAFPVPMILCQTVYLYPYGVSYLLCQVLVGCMLFGWCTTCTDRTGTAIPPEIDQVSRLPRPASNIRQLVLDDTSLLRVTLTFYRSSLMLLTVIAILAVDFPIFPRRFGKTEVEGYGLMDLGAASFVVAAGLVSPRARAAAAVSVSQTRINNVVDHWPRRTLGVWTLGLLRYATHQELDYQEHVSEYGVHWNFFWTLALLEPTAKMLSYRQQQRHPSWIPSAVILVLYQWVFLKRGGQEWMATAPRTCTAQLPASTVMICHFAMANREGLLGLLMYAALYLVTEWIAFTYLWTTTTTKCVDTLTPVSWMSHFPMALSNAVPLSRVLVTLLFVWQFLLVVLHVPVSRRSTNASFVLWVLFVNVLQLTSIDFVVRLVHCSSMKQQQQHQQQQQQQQKRDHDDLGTAWIKPLVLGAINRHGLIVFVVANLLTGLTNLSINTLQVGNGAAVAILLVYISAVGACAMVLDKVRSFLPRMSRNKQSVKND